MPSAGRTGVPHPGPEETSPHKLHTDYSTSVNPEVLTSSESCFIRVESQRRRTRLLPHCGPLFVHIFFFSSPTQSDFSLTIAGDTEVCIGCTGEVMLVTKKTNIVHFQGYSQRGTRTEAQYQKRLRSKAYVMLRCEHGYYSHVGVFTNT